MCGTWMCDREERDAYQEEINAAWDDEIQRRSREIEEGTVELVPWEEVKMRLKNISD